MKTNDISLEAALALISDRIEPVETEIIDCGQSLGRISAESYRSRLPVPLYHQSTRDGYAVGPNVGCREQDLTVFTVRGEIPAGCGDDLQVLPNDAYRIMTGGLVPAGAERVVPQEECFRHGSEIRVPAPALARQKTFIEMRGSTIAPGDLLLDAGSLIQAEDIASLAACGLSRLRVHRPVRVGFFCSGSELVGIDEELLPGRKMCSNRYLLANLIMENQMLPIDGGIAFDEPEAIRANLQDLAASPADCIISTGGMGPGKYDLIGQVFESCGGQVFFDSLAMRPGKSVLFGVVKGKPFFGLPGPPAAVTILFHELVAPALKRLQGIAQFHGPDIQAHLAHDLVCRNSEVLHIKEAVRYVEQARLLVRLREGREPANCHMLLLPDISILHKGEVVITHERGRSRFRPDQLAGS